VDECKPLARGASNKASSRDGGAGGGGGSAAGSAAASPAKGTGGGRTPVGRTPAAGATKSAEFVRLPVVGPGRHCTRHVKRCHLIKPSLRSLQRGCRPSSCFVERLHLGGSGGVHSSDSV